MTAINTEITKGATSKPDPPATQPIINAALKLDIKITLITINGIEYTLQKK